MWIRGVVISSLECAVIQLIRTRNAQKLAQCVITIDFPETDGLLADCSETYCIRQTEIISR